MDAVNDAVVDAVVDGDDGNVVDGGDGIFGGEKSTRD
jgi:hypothetical protein